MPDFEAVNENLRCALAGFSWVSDAGETDAIEGMSLAYSGVPFGLFNTAVLTRPVIDGRYSSYLHGAADYFKQRRAPWSVWFCEDYFNGEERRRAGITMATVGLKPVMDTPGMIARELAAPRGRLPSIDCRPVGDARTRADFSHIMATAFQVPVEVSNRVYASERLWQGPIRGYVGYVKGVAVSTTAIMLGGGVIGLYAVATHMHFQRRGYGEALMRLVLAATAKQTGMDTVVLQSSSMGYPLYLRMGFREVTRFGVFATD
ncbi:MAG: GNAT family N-acetyltransferase [Bryobacteraceae bacterium]|nr:GNAT family N-acetyltransferase [Bryobacteraceae bacterium]